MLTLSAGAHNIELRQGEIEASFLVGIANDVNSRLKQAQVAFGDVLDLYEIIDLRMLSGLVGEFYVGAVAKANPLLMKNPNLDGYPDLCDMSDAATVSGDVADFLHFEVGGIEIKNTFGVKAPGVTIGPRETRAGKISSILVWKAHHQFTNSLLALQSDYIEAIPQIVRGFFSEVLEEADWTIRAVPSTGSTMTSFCQTRSSAFVKLRAGELFRMAGYGHV